MKRNVMNIKDDKKRIRRLNSLSVIVTAVIIILTVAVILGVKTGVFKTALNELFNKSDPAGENTEDLPLIDRESPESQSVYYENDTEDLFSSINNIDAYRQTICITHSDSDEEERITVTKSGEKCKIESDIRTIIYNGDILYVKIGEFSNKSEKKDFDLSSELGITPIDEIIGLSKRSVAKCSISKNGKIINVEHMGENGITSQFSIDVETGLVIYECLYYSGTAYKTVYSEAIDIFGADGLPDDFWKIPD